MIALGPQTQAAASPRGHRRLTLCQIRIVLMSPSLIGRLGSSTFRLSTTAVSMSLTGSRFFFGIGTKALPLGSEDEAEQSIGRPCRQLNGRSKATCELTSSIVPRGTSFHRRVELECPPIGYDPAQSSCCCRRLLSAPLNSVPSTQIRCIITANRGPTRRSPFSCRGAWRSASPRP